MTDRTNRIPILEDRIQQLAEDLDPGDMLGVLAAIADHEGMELQEFLETGYALDLLNITQSNYDRSVNRMRRIARLDDAIATYDDEALDPGLTEDSQ